MKRKFWEIIIQTEEGDRKLLFSSYEDFYKILTPQRMEILSVLGKSNVSSINDLVRKLGRDYKNVLGDLRILESAGFIKLRLRLNRKIPELVAKGFKLSVNLDGGLPVHTEKFTERDERLSFGEQLLKQKYLCSKKEQIMESTK